jgi:hypothetical protein
MDRATKSMWKSITESNISAVQLAVESGANIHSLSEDGTGKTTLHEAALVGSMTIFRFLHQRGVDLGRRRLGSSSTTSGPAPLHYAARYNRGDMVSYILDNGFDLNAVDDQGFSALHLAVKYNYYDLAQNLLNRGIRTDLISVDKRSLRDLAMMCGKNPSDVQRWIELLDQYDNKIYHTKTPSKESNLPKSNHRINNFLEEPVYSSTTRNQRIGAMALQRVPTGAPTTVYGASPERDGVSAYHSASGASQNVGNMIGTKSTVRQSKFFRMYESGNNVKSILGNDNLSWDVNKKQGAYKGSVYDFNAEEI